MSVSQALPDFDGVWRVKTTEYNGATNRPLDGLPQPSAAWWPGWQLFSAYAGTLVSCINADGSTSADAGPGTTGQVDGAVIADVAQDQLAGTAQDQSGNARDLTAPDTSHAPKLYDVSTERYEQQNLSLVLGYEDPGHSRTRSMVRADALGLGADPALTICFKAKFAAITPPTFAPNVLALGNAVTPELCLFGNTTLGGDVIGLTSFDGASGTEWTLPLGTIDQLHSYIITKPAGTGYDGSTWKLFIDGVDQGPASDVFPGALTLGSALTQLGDVPGEGFEFDGTLAGCIVWPVVLDAPQLAQLQTFLDSV